MAKKLKKSKIKDLAIVPSEIKIPNLKPVQNLAKVQSPVHVFFSNMVTNPTIRSRRGIFEPSEYDLYEIGRIEDVESYTRQAFKKKVGLFLKEGFDYIGANKKLVKYVRLRFKQIAAASGVPHEELIRRTVSSLIRKSNAFLIKVRDLASSGGKIRTDGQTGKELEPVAGYFLAPPETMEVDTDGSGRPIKWRQRMPNGATKEFRPEDVIHFTLDRKEGFLFGTPILTPVIDDIKTLRKIEENIELLIYKHLFPLFQYIVGTETAPAGITENGEREVDVVKFQIQNIPSEGAIVTPERHEIKAIGAENQALRADEYLEHFKKRVFSGLGMSAVDFGEPDTSNKSTADNMSRALIDDVKDLQDTFEAQFNAFVLQELLLESTFGDDILMEENVVTIKFYEIDIDKQIKIETHAADQFAKNALSWDEVREIIGRDPIAIPDNPEDQDPTKFPEWHRTNWKLFDEPGKFIAATKGSSVALEAQALVGNRSISATGPQLAASQQATKELEKVKHPPKPVTKKDSVLDSEFNMLSEAIVSTSRSTKSSEPIVIKNITYAKTMIESLKSRLISHMYTAFITGVNKPVDKYNLHIFSIGRKVIQDRANLLIDKLIKDIQGVINKRKLDITNQVSLDATLPSDTIFTIRVIFDTFKHRLHFIADTENKKAYNLGKLATLYTQNVDKIKIIVQDDACDICKQYKDMIVDSIHMNFDKTLPHHPGCKCSFVAS